MTTGVRGPHEAAEALSANATEIIRLSTVAMITERIGLTSSHRSLPAAAQHPSISTARFESIRLRCPVSGDGRSPVAENTRRRPVILYKEGHRRDGAMAV